MATSAIDALAAEIASLRRQVTSFSAPQLPNSAIDDGAILSKTIDGTVGAVIGKQYDNGHGVLAVTGPVPPTPTAPTLEQSSTGVLVGWEGGYLPLPPPTPGQAPTPEIAPSGFGHVEVHLSTDPAFSGLFFTTKVGEILSARGGSVNVPVGAGVEVYGRLVVRNDTGQASVPGPVAGPVAGGKLSADQVDIDLSDLTGTTVWYNDIADPPATPHAGDLWLAEPDNIASRYELDDLGAGYWLEIRDAGVVKALQDAQDAVAAAEQAGIDALAAQNAVAGKIDLYDQTSAPAGDIAANSLWLDDANLLHVYAPGTGWVASRDTAITAAATAAANAQTAADGKVRIFVQASPPTGLTASDVDDTWIDSDDDNRLYTWALTSGSTYGWVSRQLGTAAFKPNSIVASTILATGTIEGALLSATAIDGKTITGALIRTAASGQRLELDSINGLRGMDSTGAVKTQVGTNGQLTAVDATISGTLRTATSGPRIEMAQAASQAFSTSGALKFFSGYVNTVPAAVEFTVNAASQAEAGAILFGHSLTIDSGASNAPGPKLTMSAREAPAGGYEATSTLTGKLSIERDLTSKPVLTPVPWFNTTFVRDLGGGFETVKYWVDASGMAHVSGVMTTPGAQLNGDYTLFTLPSALGADGGTHIDRARVNDGFEVRIDVNQAGGVAYRYIAGPAIPINSYVVLNLSWRIKQS